MLRQDTPRQIGAGLEKARITLTLRERAASVVDQYANARIMAVEYRDEIFPAQKSLRTDV